MPRQVFTGSFWMETTQRFSKLFHFSLHRSKEAPAGTKAEMSEDEERCLPRLKGRQCHLETFWQDWGFSPANVLFWSQRAPLILIPNDSKVKPVCSLYPTGCCFHLPVFKCAFIRSVSALTSLKSSGQSENTHFLHTRLRWGLAQMRKSHSFHRLMRMWTA